MNLNTATTTVLRKTPTPTKPLHNIMAIGTIHLVTWLRIIGKLRPRRGFQNLRFPLPGLPRCRRRLVLGTGHTLCHPQFPCLFLYTLLSQLSLLLFLKHRIRQPGTISSTTRHPTPRDSNKAP